MRLKLKTDQVGEVTILAVAGEVDIHTTPQLRAKLMELVHEEEVLNIIVDLRAVSFIDSTGLGALIGGLKRTRLRGGYLELIVTRSSTLKIFEITGLADVFVIYSSTSDALASRDA